MKLAAFFDMDIEGEIIEEVQRGNLVHVGIVFEMNEFSLLFEAVPNWGVRLKPYIHNERKNILVPIEYRDIYETRMIGMLGKKYSWLSDFLAPFHARIRRSDYKNCVESVCEVLGMTDKFYPEDVVLAVSRRI